MAVVDEINVNIKGQVDADMVNVKRRVIAELELICSKYGLDLEEKWK